MTLIRRSAARHLAEWADKVRKDADLAMPVQCGEWPVSYREAARELLASERPRPDVPGPMPYAPDGGNWEGGCRDTQGRQWVHVPNEGWRLS